MNFDAREATVRSVHDVLFSGRASCRDVVQAFLARIEAHNPVLNAIICLNPDALRAADELDTSLAAGRGKGLLFGVPILLKDNFDAVGMRTTAGSLAFRELWPTEDADVVAALKRAGAVILGKANMHEFALEGLTVSSLGGQTFNPYDLTRTPGGSSGGSGAAVAASLAVMATGTDTVNSLRNPASANSLYSFRPTPGLISKQGIVPVSSTQDAAGMIGRSLMDIATALTVMSTSIAGKLGSKVATFSGHNHNIDYTQALTTRSPKPLHSFRIGILCGFFDESQDSLESLAVNNVLDSIFSILRDAGATMCYVRENHPWNAPNILAIMDLQTYEIRQQMDDYLSSPSLRGEGPRSFADIFNPPPTGVNLGSAADQSYLIIPHQYDYIHAALSPSFNTHHASYKCRQSLIETLTQNLHSVFKSNCLDCIIYPQQRHLAVPVGSSSQSGRNGILAAVTGSPVICMPAGFGPPSDSAPVGVPVGMEILGLPGSEESLFQVAGAIDEVVKARKAPITAGLSERVNVTGRYESVPAIIPRGLASVTLESYPPGKI